MILEICVDDVTGLDIAVAGGGDRLELCAALPLGGLTPAPSLIGAARDAPIPAHLLVRPRAGHFVYSPREAAMMASDITTAAQAGLAGIVFGAHDADGKLATALLAQLIALAHTLGNQRKRRLSLTLHRAFDLCPDLPQTLDEAITLGFDRVLTSGGARTAAAGADMLGTLHVRAAGRITIIAGSGIDVSSVTPLIAAGIREIHASCGAVPQEGLDADGALCRFGFASPGQRHTDIAAVRTLKTEMERAASSRLNNTNP